MPQNAATTATPRTIAGLPRPLFPVTGFTSFDWFAFYGTQTLIIYYVYFAATDGGLELPETTAISLVSAFTAVTFLGTIFTSWLVDRLLGAGLGLRVGAVSAVLGYLALALIPGAVGLAVGLTCLTLSSALTMVAEGTLTSGIMDATPAKREAGFTIYYWGSALGAFVGVTVSGFVQAAWGFQAGFLISAVAISVALAIYLPFRRSVEAGSPPPARDSRPRGAAMILPFAGAFCAYAVLVVAIVIGWNPAMLIAIGSLVYVLIVFSRFFTLPTFTSTERGRVARYIPFFLATVVFNLLYQQLYTTVAIYSEARTDRFLFGLELPPNTVLGIAPLCTIIVAPLLAALWGFLGTRQPSLATKFMIAFACCGAAMASLAISSLQPITPLIILALIVFVFGAADVVVSPSGLSLATESAPNGNKSRMLSLQYVGISLGVSIAGVAGEWFVTGAESGYFAAFSLIGFAVAAGMLLVRIVLGRRSVV
ncbi:MULTISPECIES: peptide MFS transporter [unclassified Microbacterium]|uniref:peptide MFS transporter n=1 Tax=unclassified Microbacterium TaxID=2609290 RepID=UPI0009E03FDE|nr:MULTISPECIES: oligopeptide:H+ symporter [unclassified Microbacterium]